MRACPPPVWTTGSSHWHPRVNPGLWLSRIRWFLYSGCGQGPAVVFPVSVSKSYKYFSVNFVGSNAKMKYSEFQDFISWIQGVSLVVRVNAGMRGEAHIPCSTPSSVSIPKVVKKKKRFHFMSEFTDTTCQKNSEGHGWNLLWTSKDRI